jgi:hypothetical protein
MFRPATLSTSVHLRAWPGVSTAATQWPEVGPLFAKLCFSQKKCPAMSDSDNEGQQQIADIQPALDPSDEADKDASELQEATAKKSKRKSLEGVLELMKKWDPTSWQQPSTASSSRLRLHVFQRKKWPKAASAQFVLARRKPLIWVGNIKIALSR